MATTAARVRTFRLMRAYKYWSGENTYKKKETYLNFVCITAVRGCLPQAGADEVDVS